MIPTKRLCFSSPPLLLALLTDRYFPDCILCSSSTRCLHLSNKPAKPPAHHINLYRRILKVARSLLLVLAAFGIVTFGGQLVSQLVSQLVNPLRPRWDIRPRWSFSIWTCPVQHVVPRPRLDPSPSTLSLQSFSRLFLAFPISFQGWSLLTGSCYFQVVKFCLQLLKL